MKHKQRIAAEHRRMLEIIRDDLTIVDEQIAECRGELAMLLKEREDAITAIEDYTKYIAELEEEADG